MLDETACEAVELVVRSGEEASGKSPREAREKG